MLMASPDPAVVARVMTSIAAKKLLTAMPNDVFLIWLAPLVSANGWPFRSISSPTAGTVWTQYFDGHSIKAISQLSWKRHPIPCLFNSFVPICQDRIRWIIDAHTKGLKTPCANLKNGGGKASFLRSRSFIARTGRLHTPAILIKQPGGYQIMDGNHRISAMFTLNPSPLTMIDAWVGVHPHTA
jgi:hypothetical protein